MCVCECVWCVSLTCETVSIASMLGDNKIYVSAQPTLAACRNACLYLTKGHNVPFTCAVCDIELFPLHRNLQQWLHQCISFLSLSVCYRLSNLKLRVTSYRVQSSFCLHHHLTQTARVRACVCVCARARVCVFVCLLACLFA